MLGELLRLDDDTRSKVFDILIARYRTEGPQAGARREVADVPPLR